ncbi:MAG: ribosome biogenesis GTPase Der [Geminicoccaceae bacterium]|nr:MAG: ribosome biogenesis GTPase Der [Geminicoccaceae bacterium]
MGMPLRTTVAILGRPNVGKSTLFNRLIGRRLAIVDDTPGVTRDRLEGEGRLFDLQFRVIDTAGMEEATDESLPGRLRRSSETALDEADVGVFVIDAKVGVTALDESLADALRERGKPLILVANKAESDGGRLAQSEAWRLRLGEPIPMAAAHAQGLDDLADALRPFVAVEEPAEDTAGEAADAVDDADAPRGPLRLAVIGRPNAGKSSLVNRLLGSERLLTGPEPGLTRDAVSIGWTFKGQAVELVDTAGLRRRSRIAAGSLEKVSTSATVETVKRCGVALLVLDATQPFERQDQTIADLVLREGRCLVIALNKWDLVDAPKELLKEIHHRLGLELAQAKGVPAVPISALTGRGLDKLMQAIVQQYERWNRRVPTAALNRWFQTAVDANPPPLVKGRRIKLRYVTQAKGRPPTFALFGNQLAELPESYLRYLTGGLRDAFDFQGVPIRWHRRQGKNPYVADS